MVATTVLFEEILADSLFWSIIPAFFGHWKIFFFPPLLVKQSLSHLFRAHLLAPWTGTILSTLPLQERLSCCVWRRDSIGCWGRWQKDHHPLRLEKLLFECSHQLKKLLASHSPKTTSVTHPESSEVKLPKLDIPTFDGNIDILNLNNSGSSSLYLSMINLASPMLKSLYISNKPSRMVLPRALIEGLSRSIDHYHEVVDCLKFRYDHPCLIQQTHVQMFIDAPLKDDSVVRNCDICMHDTIKQHLYAHSRTPTTIFLAYSSPHAVIELKLNTNTFEWQDMQTKTDVPPYKDLLDFTDHIRLKHQKPLSSSKRIVKNESTRRSLDPWT